jgi:hypothetical protein
MQRMASLIGLTAVAVTLFLSYVPLRNIMLVVPTFGLTFQELRFVAYLVMAFVLALGFRSAKGRGLVVLGLTVFVGAIEIAQHWIPQHHPDVREFASSVVASVGGVSIAAVVDRLTQAVAGLLA